MFVNSDVLEPTDGTLIVSQEFFSASGILKQRPRGWNSSVDMYMYVHALK